MLYRFGSKRVQVNDIIEEDSTISQHTGTKLEKITFTICIRYNDFDEFQDILKSSVDGGIFNLTEDGNIIKEYKLIDNSYSYSDAFVDENTIYTYTLQLCEKETLDIECLCIADIEVYPYKYHEKIDKGIMITANIRVKKSDDEKLIDLASNEKYFKVIRKGISEEIKMMRFGAVYWSEDEEYIKQNITLVENIYDNEEPDCLSPYEIEIANIMNVLSYLKNLNKELTELLIAKNNITKDELSSIETKAKQDIHKTSNIFFQVKDIDTIPF